MQAHHVYDREPVEVPYHGFHSPGTGPEDTQAIEGRGLIGVFDFAASPEPLVVKMADVPSCELVLIGGSPSLSFFFFFVLDVRPLSQGPGPTGIEETQHE